MKDRRIDEIETCNDLGFKSYMVHLKPGWRLGDDGCHTFGEDTTTLIKQSMKFVQPCGCRECVSR